MSLLQPHMPMEPPVFEKSRPGRRGAEIPPSGVPPAGARYVGAAGLTPPVPASTEPVPSLAELLPGVTLRSRPPALPELAEPQVVRHYTRLSQLNYAIDLGIYPLGSCSMKYNPKLNDELASLPGFANLHPYQAEADVQGTLRLMWELEQALLAITGMTRISLQPSAGAHAELAGILMIRAYHGDHGGAGRDTVLVPDSAHGTNLATATMAGYQVKELQSTRRGLLDPEAVRAALSDRTAALMLTNPNTLGLFEEDILEITCLVHEAGALVYYDGANLNAIMGKTRPGDMGMDVVHTNLHKTFSTPHGGGGPGAGPVAVGDLLEPYLPVPLVARREAPSDPVYFLDSDRPRSIGRVKGFYGNIGVAVRAFAYILRMGGAGLTRASEDAVLNANYLRARLHDLYDVPFDRLNMHEFVASAVRQKKRGVPAMALAKRILDYGMHAPTVYFPLIVPEAMMIEPTESEDLPSLDAFVDVLRSIDEETRESPELVLEAPHTTPVSRPDEVRAARQPVLRWLPAISLEQPPG